MGDRAPDEGRMQQTRNLEVVDELPLSLEETVVSLRGERRPIAVPRWSTQEPAVCWCAHCGTSVCCDAASIGIHDGGVAVHLHRLPDSDSTISSRVGCGFSASRATSVTMKPGVQKHTAGRGGAASPPAGVRRCRRLRSSPPVWWTFRPSTWAAKHRHARAAFPSISTVQAPHTPCSHRRESPFGRSPSRKSTTGVEARPVAWSGRRFRVKVISMVFPAGVRGA